MYFGQSGPEIIKLLFILNSAEHEMYPANKYQSADNFDIFPAEQS